MTKATNRKPRAIRVASHFLQCLGACPLTPRVTVSRQHEAAVTVTVTVTGPAGAAVCTAASCTGGSACGQSTMSRFASMVYHLY
ncbi:MAG: hypothetical protein R6U98_22710 [Pirellulaceae bacterium]